MSSKRLLPCQAGMTLIELIVAMVIVAVAVSGTMAAFTRINRASVDPVVDKQLAVAAEGIMTEVLLKPYDLNPAAAPTRDTFNDVRDFHNYGLVNGVPVKGITDVNGNPIAALAEYSVVVSVSEVTLAGATDALLIQVTVSRGASSFTLSGWRMGYA